MILMRLTFLFVAGVNGYLDHEYAVVKRGPENSFFGFTLLSHKSGSNYWLVVGAPLANSTFFSEEDRLNSGAVYKCSSTDPQPKCDSQIAFDGEKKSNLETKTGQWFGVSLKTTGPDQSIVGCAHRYVHHKDGDHRLILGKCWKVDSDFDRESGFSPCFTPNADAPDQNYEYYGWCQAGLGLDAYQQSDESMYLVGTPGALRWSGAVFKTSEDEDDVEGFVGEQRKDSYFGYSVTHGDLYKEGEINVAIGGPRHNSYGKVLIYKENLGKYVQELPASAEEIQLASGFGIAICTVDSDNNGLSELLVGAPFYAQSSSIQNQGLVYVYEKDKSTEKLVLKKTLFGLLDGTSDLNSHFGYAIQNGGDLNLDGYEDIIVGAPFEDDGAGSIYIFQGSNAGLTLKYSQHIRAIEITTGLTNRLSEKLNLMGFGRSIGTGMDMDLNGYNDIAVGAFASDQVVLLRTRPVVQINMQVSFEPENINVTDKKCIIKGVPTPCFKMIFCYNFTEKNANVFRSTDSIPVKYVITADPIKQPRINFPGDVNTHSEVLDTKKSSSCKTFKDVYLVYNNDNRIPEYPDVIFNVEFSLPYGSDGFPKPSPSDVEVVNLKQYPHLEENFDGGIQSEKHFLDTRLRFQRDCTKCIPDLYLNTEKKHTIRLGRETYTLNATVYNAGPDQAYGVGLKLTLPSDLKLDSIEIDNHKTKYCQNDSCEDVWGKFEKGRTAKLAIILTTLDFGPKSDNKLTMKITSVNPEQDTTVTDNMAEIVFDLKVEADVEILHGQSTQQVEYGGEIEGESVMKSQEQVGERVDHKYLIHNNGPDLLPSANFTIRWPYQLLSGKHLLYLIDVIISSNSIQCETPDKNELNLQPASRSTNPSRTRRDVDNPSEVSSDDSASSLSDGNTAESVIEKETRKKHGRILNCSTARCTIIKCSINSLTAKETEVVTVQSRLWKSSLLIDYYGEVVTIVSTAEVEIASNVSYITDPNKRNNINELFTIVNPVFAPVSKETIAAWMIALAVIAGVILLALLVFGFYKLGFFKRKRADDSKYGKSDDKADKALLGKKR